MDPVVDALENVSDCEAAIARFEASGRDRHDPIIIQVKRRRNSLLPIYRLHRELWHHIFQFVLSSPRGIFKISHDPPDPFQYYPPLFTLRQVSHNWEHEITTTSLFWAFISPRFQQSFQDLIWERSGNAGMDVDLSRIYSSYWSAWTEPEKAFLDRVMKREIRELHAVVPVTENFEPYIVGYNHPRMTSLSLHGEGQLIWTRPPCTPQLAEILLVSCSVPWDSLRNLRLLSISINSGPNLAQLVQILQSCPLLEQLGLTDIRTPGDDPSNEAVVPMTPIELSQLSTINVNGIPLNLASGLLERLFPSSTCRVATIQLMLEGVVDLSAISHHAGRICAPRGPAEQITDPLMNMLQDSLQVQVDWERGLRMAATGRGGWDEQFIKPPRTELARIFFNEASKAVSSTIPITRFSLRSEGAPDILAGLATVHECFPEIVELGLILSTKTDLEALEALGKPRTTEGKEEWLLPKLSILKVKTLAARGQYDGAITTAIKRTQAAAESSHVLSPITSLALVRGRVNRKNLEMLDGAGIKYQLDRVTIL